MRQKISRDTRQPVGAQRVEARLLDRIEQRCGLGFTRLVMPVNRVVVESTLQDEPIRERTKTAVCGGTRLREQCIGVIDVTERPGTGRHRARLSMVRYP